MKLFSVLVLSIISLCAFAGECDNLAQCVDVVSKLSGKKYIFDSTLKIKTQSSPNLSMTKENVDVVFTKILELSDLTRIPTQASDTFTIISQRDTRGATLPILSANLTTPPLLPVGSDFCILKYTFKNFDQNQPVMAARSLRSHNSRYGRISELGSSILVTDTADKLGQFYELIKGMDRPFSKNELESMRKHEEMLHKMRDGKGKNDIKEKQENKPE